jgi:glycosyltransferase involved in cell wall biosynthesis
MQIMFVGPVPPLTGGISQHSHRLVEALRAHGHTVDIASWRSGAEFYLKWWSLISWWHARKAAAHYDLLIYPYVTPFLALAQWFISGGANSVLAVVHNAFPHEKMPFERPLGRLALRNATRALAHGRGVADDLRGLPVDCEIDVLPMPPILDMSPSEPPPRPPFRVLFVGYVRPYKGLGVAISSLALLRGSGIDSTLTIVGDFWEPIETYLEQIRRFQLEDVVDIRPGYARDQDLQDALRSHHVVIAPYLEDSLSGVIPLAFAAGRPVVSTAVRGISEQVRDGYNGILAKPGDDRSLADALGRSLGQYEELRAGARESSFTWSQLADSIAAQFEHLNDSHAEN